jgi:hypothetical protein
MTKVTFEWDTEAPYKEYAFWKHSASSASAVVNMPAATYELEPGAYDMFWRAYGAKKAPVKLRIHADGVDLRLIETKTSSAGTGGGPSKFKVPRQ